MSASAIAAKSAPSSEKIRDCCFLLSWAFSQLPRNELDKITRTAKRVFAKNSRSVRHLSFKGAWWQRKDDIGALAGICCRIADAKEYESGAPLPGVSKLFSASIERLNLSKVPANDHFPEKDDTPEHRRERYNWLAKRLAANEKPKQTLADLILGTFATAYYFDSVRPCLTALVRNDLKPIDDDAFFAEDEKAEAAESAAETDPASSLPDAAPAETHAVTADTEAPSSDAEAPSENAHDEASVKAAATAAKNGEPSVHLSDEALKAILAEIAKQKTVDLKPLDASKKDAFEHEGECFVLMHWALDRLPREELDRAGKTFRRLFANTGAKAFRQVSFKGAWWKNTAIVSYWHKVVENSGSPGTNYLPGITQAFDGSLKRFEDLPTPLLEVLVECEPDEKRESGLAVPAEVAAGLRFLSMQSNPQLTLADEILIGFCDGETMLDMIGTYIKLASCIDLMQAVADGKAILPSRPSPEKSAEEPAAAAAEALQPQAAPEAAGGRAPAAEDSVPSAEAPSGSAPEAAADAEADQKSSDARESGEASEDESAPRDAEKLPQTRPEIAAVETSEAAGAGDALRAPEPAVAAAPQKAEPPARKEPARTEADALASGPALRCFDSSRRFVVTHPLKAGNTRYLGHVRLLNGFLNFYILAEWAGDRFIRVEKSFAMHDFPKFGAFNIDVKGGFARTRREMADGSLAVAEIAPSDHTLSGNDAYVYCVDYNYLRATGQLLTAAQFGVSLIARPAEPLSGIPDFESPVYVKLGAADGSEPKLDMYKGAFQVLLHAGDKLYGPLPLKETSGEPPRMYVDRPHGALASKGLIPAWKFDKAACIECELFHLTENGIPVYAPILFAQTSGLEAVDVDFFSDEELLDSLSQKDAALLQDEIAAALSDSPSPGSAAEEEAAEIVRSRRVRIQSLLESRRIEAGMLDHLVQFVYERLLSKDRDAVKALIGRAAKDPEFRRIAAGSSAFAVELKNVQKRIQTAEAEVKTKKQQLAVVEKAISAAETRRDAIGKEVEARFAAFRDLDLTEEALRDRKAILAENAKLKEEADRIEALRTKLIEEVDKAQQKAAALQGILGEDVVPQLITDACAKLHARTEEEALAAAVRVVNARSYQGPKGADLARELIKAVQSVRDYDENTVLNLYISLAQNFLTVFAGEPGSGKTSICSILGRTMGLTNVRAAGIANRFVEVPVEYGWTTKRDFIGFHNPLTGRFESPDPDRWRLIRQLDAEARSDDGSRFPAVMVLDEANLSPMEYYWSDWMRLCDAHEGNGVVNLADGIQSRIPPTMRFLATINNDSTTEALSPRLIDRATIVTLPVPTTQKTNTLQQAPEGELIPWDAFTEVFASGKGSLSATTESALAGIYAEFERIGIRMSARSKLQILRYVTAASGLFRGNAETDALDFTVMQKLLPRINGTGAAYRQKLEDLMKAVKRRSLSRSAAQLEGILMRGDEAMDCFRFF